RSASPGAVHAAPRLCRSARRVQGQACREVRRSARVTMQLSTDDLPMFFDKQHVALAARLREAAPLLEQLEREAASDRDIVGAFARSGLFDLVCPAPGGKVDTR